MHPLIQYTYMKLQFMVIRKRQWSGDTETRQISSFNAGEKEAPAEIQKPLTV